MTVADSPSISSTELWREEKEREELQRRRAEERSQSIHRSLKSAGRELATNYGAALFRAYCERVNDGLEALFGRVVRGEALAGQHYEAVPVLLMFHSKGLRPAAALALGVVIDKLTQRRAYRDVAQAIGKEIEDEARAMRIEGKDGDLLRLLKKRGHGRRNEVVGQKVMEALDLGGSKWSSAEKATVGGLLLDLVVAQTGLVQVVRPPGKRTDFVEPTQEALILARANPPRPLPARKLPMLVPPRPWDGLIGGGHLDNKAQLVTSRKPMDLSHFGKADMGFHLQVVNALQRQEMTIDPWMVEQQRAAWDGNIRGLFKTVRDPSGDWQEQIAGRGVRVRIEESIRQCESVAGRPVWFAYDYDYRGRIYSSNRYVTHQGPDSEKGVVSFSKGEVCDGVGFDWLLKAAAGHYGLGKAKWEERLQWGKDNLGLMCAAAEAPLERLELWRGADDPWQFLQAAKAVKGWLQDPSAPLGCPVRLDQTCSGVGIAAALMRDSKLARHTNLTGTTRHDIYQVVADRLIHLLRSEIEASHGFCSKWAAFWLDFGIDRAMCKGPVMTSVYGATHLGLVDAMVAHLEQERGQADLERIQKDVLVPVRYLVGHLKQALADEIGSCLALRDWLRLVCSQVVKTQRKVEWTSPTGWPMSLGQEAEETVRNRTVLSSTPRSYSRRQEPKEGELSVLATNRGITANLAHSFDAALAHVIVSRAEGKGLQVLTNHDCFAAVPAQAEWLHRQLHEELRELYKTDWLAAIGSEIACRSGIKGLPKPPRRGDLAPGLVGQNAYCFS